jgi:hypothetical protein
MITCKEDMRGCYALRCDKEVFELFMDNCEQFGIKWAGRRDDPRDCQFGEAVVFSGTEEDKLTHGSEPGMKQKGYKRLTLSDLKPRTKVEYEHLERSSFNVWDLKSLLENGELYSKTSTGEYDQYSKSSQTYMLRHFMEYGVYRKVERPVEWWDDAVEYIRSLNGEANAIDFTDAESDGKKMAINISVVLDERQAKDFARILLEQEGE